ncbi:MAG: Rrf2 family transcriptional regulator [Bdellovibrionaceae bacterium]|nr:Rrf2 family transcriptional regulator [Pseudobdellovibrionaceae bacterium]MBX3034093.1 Rrf2 family transcriptional regulator [Pseudobdellovibrionaceae bacterium]
MNRINRKLEYALMALKYMSQKTPGELTTAKEVCDTLRTPFDATARVMQIMASKGLLRSEQGASGGYQILKDLGKINLLELLEMIEGPQAIVKCIHRASDVCEIHSTCNIASPLSRLNHRLHDFYRGVSLRDLVLDAPGVKASPRREALHG